MAGDDRLAAMSAGDMVRGIATRTLSPVEVHDAVQAVIERAEPVLNAFCQRDPEVARKAAAASEQRWLAGARTYSCGHGFLRRRALARCSGGSVPCGAANAVHGGGKG